MSIFILTGKKSSGKTTALLEHFGHNENCGGFVSPDEKSQRIMYDIQSHKIHPFEISGSNVLNHGEYLLIGRFTFLKKAFVFALDSIQRSIHDHRMLTIIDEFGPLEMNNQGLMPVLEEYMSYFMDHEKYHALMVVREGLLPDFRQRYPSILSENIIGVNQLATLKDRLGC